MLKKNRLIVMILAVSAIVRLWGLGVYPRGLSLSEVNFFYLNPFWIRFPFFILGLVSLVLFYRFLIKFSGNEKVSLIATLVLSLTPWHFELSRVYSLAMPVFVSFLIILNLKNYRKILNSILLVLCFVFALSIFNFSENVGNRVDAQRLNVAKIAGPALTKIFVNKLTVSFQEKVGILSDGFDPGLYFFKGYPRERWGIEETQKFLPTTLVFAFIGLLLVNKRKTVLMIKVFSMFLLLSAILGKVDQHILLGTSIFYSYLTSLGILSSFQDRNRKNILFFLLVICIFEIIYYGNLYFKNLGENRFSPRREIYLDLTKKVKELRKENERVVVNSKLIDPEPFFRFYLKDKNLDGFEFRGFDIWQESLKDGLFIDVLAGEPGPSEPLYKLSSGENVPLVILFSLNDAANNQIVYIYRYK